MAGREMSRRQFVERSITSSLAASMAWGSNPGRVGASASVRGAERLTLKVIGDTQRGCAVTILFGGQPARRRIPASGRELSLTLGTLHIPIAFTPEAKGEA